MLNKIGETIAAIGIFGAVVTLCLFGIAKIDTPDPIHTSGLMMVVWACAISCLVLIAAATCFGFVNALKDIWSRK